MWVKNPSVIHQWRKSLKKIAQQDFQRSDIYMTMYNNICSYAKIRCTVWGNPFAPEFKETIWEFQKHFIFVFLINDCRQNATIFKVLQGVLLCVYFKNIWEEMHIIMSKSACELAEKHNLYTWLKYDKNKLRVISAKTIIFVLIHYVNKLSLRI